MKIALVTRHFGGGVGTSTLNQARLLARSGHRVFLLCEEAPQVRSGLDDALEIIELSPRANARSLGWSACLRAPGLRRWLSLSAIDVELEKFIAASTATLEQLDRDQQLNAVHFCDSFSDASYWRPRPHCRTVIKFSCPQYFLRELGLGGSQRVNRRFFRLGIEAVQRAEQLYSPSWAMRDLGAAYYQIAPERIAVVPNPIDTELFAPAAELPREQRILFAGLFYDLKGAELVIEVLPEILAEYPEVRFTLLGSSGRDASGRRYHDRLERRAQDLGVEERVEILGSLPHAQLPELYRQSTLLFVPTQFDSFGNTYCEAQSCGLPVVVGAAGATPEVVADGETGFLIPPRDASAARQALTRLLDDRDLCASIGDAARRRSVELWSYDRVAPALEALASGTPTHSSLSAIS